MLRITTMLRIIATMLNVLIAICLLYFLAPLLDAADRDVPSITGFAIMLWTIILDAVLIWC